MTDTNENEIEKYYVKISDLFIVDADDVDNAEEAERYAFEQLDEQGLVDPDIEVVDIG